MNVIKYVILFPPVNRYLLSVVGSAVSSVMKKIVISTVKNAYTTVINKK